MADYDILGDIVIIKGEGKLKKEKLRQAKELLKKSNIKTVLEKTSSVSGRLRTIKTKYIAGKKNLIAKHKENNCIFEFNVEDCYFSPRLSNDRKEIAQKIRKKDNVLVMFAGVGAYPIVIYRLSHPEKIIAIEIGRECCKWFKRTLKLNKIPKGKIELIQGDVKKKVNKELGKFDVIMMARPNLKNSFLEQGLIASKKGTKVFYHGFCKDEDLNKLIKELEKEAKKLKRKIKVLRAVCIGEIAPYKHRFRIEIKVLN